MLELHVTIVEVGLVLESHRLSCPGKVPLDRLSRHHPALVHFLMAQAPRVSAPAIEYLRNVANRSANLDQPEIQIDVL